MYIYYIFFHKRQNAVFNRNFLECLQLDVSSFLLLRVDISSLQVIKYFSYKHKLHLLVALEYDLACFILRHFMSYAMFLSLRFQIRKKTNKLISDYISPVMSHDLCKHCSKFLLYLYK